MKYFIATFVFSLLISTQSLFSQGWEWIDTGFDFILYDISFPPGQNSTGYAVGSDVTFDGDGIILKTTDFGATWFQISSGIIPGLEAVFFTSVDVGYAGGWQNYFIKTTDGGTTWNPQIIDPNIWYFKDIEFWDASSGVAVAAGGEVYVTSDAGGSWTPANGITQGIEDVSYGDANTLYASGGDEKISKSTDGGLTWTQIYSGIFQFIFPGVDFLNANYGIVVGEDGKVLITADGGISWTPGSAGFALYHGAYIHNEQLIHVAGTPEQVYKTTDGGNTWFSDFTSGFNVALYKVKYTDNNTGFICGSQGIIMRNLDDIIPVELSSFAAGVVDGSVVLNWSTATETNNSGFEIQKKAENSDWNKIAFVPGFGTSTEQHSYSYTDQSTLSGMYSYRLKQIDYDGSFEYSDVVEVEVIVPTEYILKQNYPNPFNPSTKIEYGISEQSFVDLRVYDILGNEVAGLVKEEKPVGSYEVEFDATSLPSGIYFYQLQAGSFVETKKMVLMK